MLLFKRWRGVERDFGRMVDEIEIGLVLDEQVYGLLIGFKS